MDLQYFEGQYESRFIEPTIVSYKNLYHLAKEIFSLISDADLNKMLDDSQISNVIKFKALTDKKSEVLFTTHDNYFNPLTKALIRNHPAGSYSFIIEKEFPEFITLEIDFRTSFYNSTNVKTKNRVAKFIVKQYAKKEPMYNPLYVQQAFQLNSIDIHNVGDNFEFELPSEILKKSGTMI